MSLDRVISGRAHESEPPQTLPRQSALRSEDGAFAQQAGGGSSPRAQSALIRVIEGEIIPRLFLAHRHRAPRYLRGQDGQDGAFAGDIENFAQLFLSGDTAQILSRLLVIKSGGIRRDRIYLDLITPVSQTLALFWEEGRCTFEEMAIGLACIDRVLREMDASEPSSHTPHEAPVARA